MIYDLELSWVWNKFYYALNIFVRILLPMVFGIHFTNIGFNVYVNLAILAHSCENKMKFDF